MITVLTLCWNFVWPLCSSVQTFTYPTYEDCDRERAALMASLRPPSRATCTPKQQPPAPIELSTVNEAVATALPLGGEVYVDFTPATAPEQQTTAAQS
jgi:hypothetical protein